MAMAFILYPGRIISYTYIHYDIFDFDIADFLKEVRSKLEMTIEQLAGGVAVI